MNIYSEPYTYEGQGCQWCECGGGGPVSVPGAAHGAAPYTGHAVAAALAVTVGGQRPLGHQLPRAVSPEQGGIFLVLGSQWHSNKLKIRPFSHFVIRFGLFMLFFFSEFEFFAKNKLPFPLFQILQIFKNVSFPLPAICIFATKPPMLSCSFLRISSPAHTLAVAEHGAVSPGAGGVQAG